MQPFDEIEFHYKNPDPWGYKTNPDDQFRKDKICDTLREKYQGFSRALDIGAGEGWITIGLPAAELHGYELSKQARSRMPFGVTPKGPDDPPDGKYDLVVTTGTLYGHYDCRTFFKLIKEHSSNIILFCNIAAWEHPEVHQRTNELSFLAGKEIHAEQFKYREFIQQLRIFKL